jgi:hypothetical protein
VPESFVSNPYNNPFAQRRRRQRGEREYTNPDKGLLATGRMEKGLAGYLADCLLSTCTLSGMWLFDGPT